MPSDRARKALISLFILLYLYQAMLLSFSVPPRRPNGWNARLLIPIRPYLHALGIYHRERWYAPNPPQTVRRISFELDDGVHHPIPWRFPRNRLLPFDPPDTFQSYLARYVFASSRQRPTQHDLVFRDLSLYIARQARLGPGGTVRVLESSAHIPPPGSAQEAIFHLYSRPIYANSTVSAPEPSILEKDNPSELLDTEPLSPEEL